MGVSLSLSPSLTPALPLPSFSLSPVPLSLSVSPTPSLPLSLPLPLAAPSLSHTLSLSQVPGLPPVRGLGQTATYYGHLTTVTRRAPDHIRSRDAREGALYPDHGGNAGSTRNGQQPAATLRVAVVTLPVFEGDISTKNGQTPACHSIGQRKPKTLVISLCVVGLQRCVLDSICDLSTKYHRRRQRPSRLASPPPPPPPPCPSSRAQSQPLSESLFLTSTGRRDAPRRPGGGRRPSRYKGRRGRA